MKPPELPIKLFPFAAQAVLLPLLSQFISDDPFAKLKEIRNTPRIMNNASIFFV